MTALYSPSPRQVNHLFSEMQLAPAGISGAGGTLYVGTAFDSRDFSQIAFVATLISTYLVNKAGITMLEIIGADDAGMSVNVVQIQTTGTIASAGKSDFVGLEIDSQDIAQIKGANGFNTRYVAARVTLGSATDVVCLTGIFGGAEAKASGLTNNLAVTAPSTT